jgi:hypothetical protein
MAELLGAEARRLGNSWDVRYGGPWSCQDLGRQDSQGRGDGQECMSGRAGKGKAMGTRVQVGYVVAELGRDGWRGEKEQM